MLELDHHTTAGGVFLWRRLVEASWPRALSYKCLCISVINSLQRTCSYMHSCICAYNVQRISRGHESLITAVGNLGHCSNNQVEKKKTNRNLWMWCCFQSKTWRFSVRSEQTRLHVDNNMICIVSLSTLNYHIRNKLRHKSAFFPSSQSRCGCWIV